METLHDLELEAARLVASTKEQRRALHRLGRSDAYIRKYANTKALASRLIHRAIDEMTEIKKKS